MKLWFLAHKGPIGGGLLAIYMYIQGNPIVYQKYPWATHAFGIVSAFLLGSGVVKSDKYYKDKREEQDAGLD